MAPRADARMALNLAAINAGIAVRHSRAGLARAGRRLRGDVDCGATPTDFDPFDPEVVADPYPAYRRLLEGPALLHNRHRALWIVPRYEDVRAGLRASDVLSSAEGVIRYRARIPMLLTVDRPEHTRLRKLVARDFSRAAVAVQEPQVEQLAREALDGLVRAGGGEWVSEVAEPLPVAVIARLLGIPSADLQAFREWSDRIVEGFGVLPGPGSIRSSASVLGAAIRLRSYFAARTRSGGSGDGLLASLSRGSEEGRLSADELFWFGLLLLVAGNETTTNLLGTMLLAFAERPDQYERVRADPALVAGAVEEALRHTAPIQGLYRTARRDYRVGSAAVPAGGRVLLLFGAANRDPRQYPDPDRFDVERNATDHLGFGSGIHFCLGAHLARLEATVVLRMLCERVRRIELAGAPVWRDSPSLRGLARLELRLS